MKFLITEVVMDTREERVIGIEEIEDLVAQLNASGQPWKYMDNNGEKIWSTLYGGIITCYVQVENSKCITEVTTNQ
jgi:hypothetical protein